MSLLIDALKQAEATRQRSGEGGATAGGEEPGLSLEPIESSSPASPPAPQAARAESPSQPPARPRHRASGVASKEPSVATRDLFEVKRQPPSRLPYYLGAIALIVLAAGAAYVWWAMQPRNSLVASGFKPGVTTPASTRLAESQITPPMPPSQAPQPAVVPERSPGKPVAASRSTEARRIRPAALNAAPADDTGVKFRPSAAASVGAPSGVQQAYSALAAGDLPQARRLYQEALRQNPQNADVLNGLGVIALRDNQPDQAERFFRSALRIDPNDGVAASQLALLYAEGDPAGAEARLRNLIAAQPANAASHFSLGNLLSRQERWGEAQQSLFQAYTLDSDNPDILFNLAVSLEHVRQPAVARQFYERALQASGKRPASFPLSSAQSRIEALGVLQR